MISSVVVVEPLLFTVTLMLSIDLEKKNPRCRHYCLALTHDLGYCWFTLWTGTKWNQVFFFSFLSLQFSYTTALNRSLSDLGLSISDENQSNTDTCCCKYRHLSLGQELRSKQLCIAASHRANRHTHKSVRIWMFCLPFLSAFCGLFTRWMAEIKPKDLRNLSAAPCY